MDKLLENLMREVERFERAYKLLPCPEMEQHLRENRNALHREQLRRELGR